MDAHYTIGTHVLLEKNVAIEPYVVIGINNAKLVRIGLKSIIRSHTVIYSGVSIGDYFQSGHAVLIREHTKIGNHVSIGSHTVIEHDVRIGNYVRIHSNAFVPEFTYIEDNVWIGPHVVCTNAKYPRSSQVKKKLKGPHIKKYAIIGANATLLPGIVIGEYALIGAGSVVVADVAARTVIAGNPGKMINTIDALPYM